MQVVESRLTGIMAARAKEEARRIPYRNTSGWPSGVPQALLVGFLVSRSTGPTKPSPLTRWLEDNRHEP